MCMAMIASGVRHMYLRNRQGEKRRTRRHTAAALFKCKVSLNERLLAQENEMLGKEHLIATMLRYKEHWKS